MSAKLWEYLFRYMHSNAAPRPSNRETSVQIRNAGTVISVPVMIELSKAKNPFLFFVMSSEPLPLSPSPFRGGGNELENAFQSCKSLLKGGI